MATGKITKRAVEGMKPGDWLWDADHSEVVKGFGARRQAGDVWYLVRFRARGKQYFRTIGRHGSPWTPDTARAKARAMLGEVASGVVPQSKRDAQPTEADTFGAEIERYLKRKHAVMKPRSFEEVDRHLTHHSAALHRLRLGEIDRRTIAKRLLEIEEESGPVARNRVRSSLSAFFAWTVREGLLETNPVAGTGKADEGPSRSRVLSRDELAEVWRALPEDQFGDIVRVLALTGQRRKEIGGLRWSEVDFDRACLVLPPERTKNSRLHEVPLSPAVKAILERQPRRPGRDLIFGHGPGPFSGWSECKARLDTGMNDQRAKPMPPWTLHDLRRTCATGMAELGTLPHVIESVLNHVSGHKAGVAGIYNRSTYPAEMREALDRWADHLAKLTNTPGHGGNPVPTLTAEGSPAMAAGPKRVRLMLVRKQAP